MNSLDLIQLKTDQFFDLHWGKSIENSRPEWIHGWDWYGSVPYHNLGGVYALVGESNEVLYIGVATPKSYGLANRLVSHVLSPNKEKGKGYYKPKNKWVKVKTISTIGFPKNYNYLSSALEIFLIQRLNPPMNKNARKKANK